MVVFLFVKGDVTTSSFDSAVSEMALNIKQNHWDVHMSLPWLHTSPVSLVSLAASKKGKIFVLSVCFRVN